MKKKTYSKPTLAAQKFEPQEYCASCEHSESGAGMYLFECNAPAGYLYLDDNGIDGLQRNGYNADRYVGNYHPCNIKHEASTTDEFRKGYIYSYSSGTTTEVIVWLERQWSILGPSYDGHATTELDQDKWEKNVS